MLELCQSLARTRKSRTFYLIDRLICLILTFSVSIATTKRSFSAMKITKTRLRNKMNDEFLADNMIIYIDKEIAENFSSDSIIDEFRDLKERRTILYICVISFLVIIILNYVFIFIVLVTIIKCIHFGCICFGSPNDVGQDLPLGEGLARNMYYGKFVIILLRTRYNFILSLFSRKLRGICYKYFFSFISLTK